eukprot:3282119-Alexandrium_andersonii.AAC.1
MHHRRGQLEDGSSGPAGHALGALRQDLGAPLRTGLRGKGESSGGRSGLTAKGSNRFQHILAD